MKAGYPQIEWVTIIFPIKIVALGYPLFLSLFGQTYMYGSLPTASTFARFYPVIMGLSTHSMKACLIKPHLDERNTCRKPTIDSRDHCLLISTQSTQSTQSTPDCLYPDFGLVKASAIHRSNRRFAEDHCFPCHCVAGALGALGALGAGA